MIALALRLLMAFALYAFLGWAIYLIWRDINQQGALVANRRVPKISIMTEIGNGITNLRHFAKDEIIIGRDPGCDIPILNDDTASTHHAQLSYHHGQWWISDLSSTNGTLLNQIAINMPTVVTSGDEIKCGNTKFFINMPIDGSSSNTQRMAQN